MVTKRKLGLVIAAADGVKSIQSGVGVVVNFFFESFEEIIVRLPEWQIDLYAACPDVHLDSPDFSLSAFERVVYRCERHRGKVIPIGNLSSGDSLNEVWKGTDQYSAAQVWESCCSGLATEINRLNQEYDRILILAHDTLFINLSAYISDFRVKVCWVPHSLGTLFEDPNQAGRICFEKEKIKNLLQRGDQVGFISHFTRAHLIEHYGVAVNNLVSFYSGIYYGSNKYQHNNFLAGFLLQYNIPADKKIIFTWGRCSDQKGIDIIIKAYGAILRDNPHFSDRYHLVLLCPIETTYKEYLIQIIRLLSDLPTNTYTFIPKFEEKIQFEILGYANTRFVLLCSRYESFGLTSIEAAYKVHSAATILYAPLPTFQEVLETYRNAVALAENTPDCLKQELLAQTKKVALTQAACEENTAHEEKFSIVKNYAFGLSQILEMELFTEA